MRVNLQFLGAAGTVTGSRYLVEAGEHRILIDCGLFQGTKELRERNWQAMRPSPGELDAVLLTHAHLDHSGGLPALVRNGFRGHIHASSPTVDLVDNMLLDSARIQESEADHANRKGYSKHHPAEPLYTEQDAQATIRRLRGHDFHEAFELFPGLRVHFQRSGHLLGASSAILDYTDDDGAPRRLMFSGDVGRWGSSLHPAPERMPAVDFLVCESTYGDRDHPDTDIANDLRAVVEAAIDRGGALVIPAFAVGRTQEVLWVLRQLEDDGAIPHLQVFVDSPLGIESSEAYLRWARDAHLDWVDEVKGTPWPKRTRFCSTGDESRSINEVQGPCVIISSSGMASGGRVLHHLRQRLPKAESTILFVGYQAQGTRGRTLLDGADSVKIHGQFIPVRAHITQVRGFSGHGDRRDLIRWIGEAAAPPGRVFVTHGEPAASAALVSLLTAKGVAAQAAQDGERIELRS